MYEDTFYSPSLFDCDCIDVNFLSPISVLGERFVRTTDLVTQCNCKWTGLVRGNEPVGPPGSLMRHF